MAKETPPFTWTGWGLIQVANYATAASTYLQKLSQACDLQDRALAHAEFVQMQIEMCNERAKAVSGAVGRANNFIGIFVSLLQRDRYLNELARKSATYSRETGGKGQERHSSSERPDGQSAENRTPGRATGRPNDQTKPKRRRNIE